MRYHFFINSARDAKRPEFDMFIMVPSLRTDATHQSSWIEFAGKHDMHAFLAVPLDDTKLRFQCCYVTVNESRYPALKVISSRYGVFWVPFAPSNLGQRQLREAYDGLRSLFRNYMRQRRSVVGESATGTDGAPGSGNDALNRERRPDNGVAGKVSLHPASAQQMETRQAEAVVRRAGAKDERDDPQGPSGNQQWSKDSNAPQRGGQGRSARRSRVMHVLRLAVLGAGMGGVGIALMSVGLPAVADEAAETDRQAVVIDVGEPEDRSNGKRASLPVPETELDVERATASKGCSSGVAATRDGLDGVSELMDDG